MRNPQHATGRPRNVEGTDQLAHADGIDVGHVRQIQQDSPLATSKTCLNPVAQPGVDRRPQCARATPS